MAKGGKGMRGCRVRSKFENIALRSTVRASLLSCTPKAVRTLVRSSYFAVWYNTTSAVNTMLAMGSVTPYVLYLSWRGELTVSKLNLAVVATFLSTYCYSVIYVINDYMDRSKDLELGIPKFTSRDVLGSTYWLIYTICYIIILAIVALTWSPAFVPMLGYSVALVILSAVHSRWAKIKSLTLFLVRALKFTSPLGLIVAATGELHAINCLIGSAIAYPIGFNVDYAYRGYFRDRLKQPPTKRYGLYCLYWLSIFLVVVGIYRANLEILFAPVVFYLGA